MNLFKCFGSSVQRSESDVRVNHSVVHAVPSCWVQMQGFIHPKRSLHPNPASSLNSPFSHAIVSMLHIVLPRHIIQNSELYCNLVRCSQLQGFTAHFPPVYSPVVNPAGVRGLLPRGVAIETFCLRTWWTNVEDGVKFISSSSMKTCTSYLIIKQCFIDRRWMMCGKLLHSGVCWIKDEINSHLTMRVWVLPVYRVC